MKMTILIILISSSLITYLIGRMHGYDKGIEDEREITDREYFRRFKIENDYIRDEKKILAGSVSHGNTFRPKRGTNAYKRAKESREDKEFTSRGIEAAAKRVRKFFRQFKREIKEIVNGEDLQG